MNNKRVFELLELPKWEDMKYKAVLYSLEGCEVFKLLDDETKTKEWNGIGPDRFPKLVRDILDTMHEFVLPAACIHDFEYVVGGTKSDFYESNARLERNMRKCLKINRKEFSLIGYNLAKIKIKISKWICNNFGLKGWKLIEK